jgi:hypothetical protein
MAFNIDIVLLNFLFSGIRMSPKTSNLINITLDIIFDFSKAFKFGEMGKVLPGIMEMRATFPFDEKFDISLWLVIRVFL